MPTAILADDERLMREQLRARLSEVWPELQILAEARNGAEAVEAVREHRPDLAFLDIRMPGMTGIEAAREIGDACHVVFITAYDEYAVEAFEQGAADYLLKPAEADRL
ncbi:MAG: LytR/AlgR family response regulator transcription factor, partial [Betaproteobacteria bacterium]